MLEESGASEDEPRVQHKDDLESLAMPAPLLQMCRRLKLQWALSVKKRLKLTQILILLRRSLSLAMTARLLSLQGRRTIPETISTDQLEENPALNTQKEKQNLLGPSGVSDGGSPQAGAG